MRKDEFSMVLDMESNITKLKAFSDILVSVSQTDELPEATSLNQLAEMMLAESKAVYDKFIELCNAYHDNEKEEGFLYPNEVRELVKQSEGTDEVYEAYMLGALQNDAE